MQKAIVCVDMDKILLSQLEKLVLEEFGGEYVVEIANKPSEALRVVSTLHELGINTAVLITGFYMPEINGLQLIEKVHLIDPKTKATLLIRQMGLESVEHAINAFHLFKIIKTNFKREEIIQVIRDACYRYNQEVELETLYRKLTESEKEKELILQSISEGMIFIDIQHNILWLNDRVNQEFKNNCKKCYEKLYGRSTPCPDCEALKALEHYKGHSTERRFANNHYKLAKYHPVQDNRDKVLGILISLTDITNRKRVEKMNYVLLEVAKLVNSSEAIVQLYENIYRLIAKELSATFMCVAGKDFDNVYIEYINGKDKLIGIVGLKNKDQQHINRLMNTLGQQLEADESKNYIITEKDNDIEIVISLHDKIIIYEFEKMDMTVDYLLTFIKALSDQVKIGVSKIESIKKITYQANHDSLTGLYNREFFLKTVNGKILSQRESDQDENLYSLAVLDLNYFKEVNDTYGHVLGDEVLFTVSQRILKSLRHGDTVARIGGDEFAMLIQQVSKSEIAKILTRIQEFIAEPIEIGKTKILIGSSIGLVYEVSKYLSSEHAIKDADIAMYEAKKDKSGIGTFKFYEKEIEKKLLNQQEMESNLRSATINKEFSMRYQPIVCMRTLKIVGFEAFIRWEKTQGLFYNPKDFLPIAEEYGHIEDIGNFVLEEVATAIDQLNDHNDLKDCFISINLSSKQFFSNQQIERIEMLGLQNKKIQIEVTEKTLFDNFDKANKSLEKLHKLGIKVHLDDFGTGYASLSCLNTSEIHDIKIDHTFVKQLPQNSNCNKVVNVILAVAKGLGMTVTAEGVEKKEQFDFLLELGCDYAQGYYISKPLTLEQVIKLNDLKEPYINETCS